MTYENFSKSGRCHAHRSVLYIKMRDMLNAYSYCFDTYSFFLQSRMTALWESSYYRKFWYSHFIIKWLGYKSFVIFRDLCMNVHWTSHKWRQLFKPLKIFHILYTVALNFAQIVHQPTQRFFKRYLNFYQLPVEWSKGYRYV